MKKLMVSLTILLFVTFNILAQQDREMVQINGGTFIMGSPASEKGRRNDEGPQRRVTVSSFFIGSNIVTVGEFRQFFNSTGYRTDMEKKGGGFITTRFPQLEQRADASWKNPYFIQDERNPVILISWLDAIHYCNWLSEKEGLTAVYEINDDELIWNRAANGYRLPTEAEWEYACRAGTTTAYNTGNTVNNNTGWYRANTRSPYIPQIVGLKPANAWGLYDMHGNVQEWCWDIPDLYPNEAQTNPTGPIPTCPAFCCNRVLRGGHAGWWEESIRSAYRNSLRPDFAYLDTSFRLARNITTFLPEMVYINGGIFNMGSLEKEVGRNSTETPQRQVTVSPFYIGKYEVTQREYDSVMGINPSHFKGYNLPVERVSWFDVIEYCNRLSQREGLTPVYSISNSSNGRTVIWNRNANGYRLPTEAEWEYACRAGTATPYNTGARIRDNTGWYNANSNNRTQPVGQKPANAWGLHDMHGNVWEYCWDYSANYPNIAQIDPVSMPTYTHPVFRGGAWNTTGQNIRSACRNSGGNSVRWNYVGFRIARNASGVTYTPGEIRQREKLTAEEEEALYIESFR